MIVVQDINIHPIHEQECPGTGRCEGSSQRKERHCYLSYDTERLCCAALENLVIEGAQGRGFRDRRYLDHTRASTTAESPTNHLLVLSKDCITGGSYHGPNYSPKLSRCRRMCYACSWRSLPKQKRQSPLVQPIFACVSKLGIAILRVGHTAPQLLFQGSSDVIPPPFEELNLQ